MIVLFIVFTTTSMWKHMLEKGIERLTTAFLELKEESPSKRENESVTLLRVLCIALLSEKVQWISVIAYLLSLLNHPGGQAGLLFYSPVHFS